MFNLGGIEDRYSMGFGSGEVTRLLREISSGNRLACDRLLVCVYDELRRLARARMARERPGNTLQATALVHEAYLRLIKADDESWENRGHFFAAASEAMRRILIEKARRRARVKRGGLLKRTTFDEMAAGQDPRPDDLLALDEALTRLEKLDTEMACVVKLKYFSGLDIDEVAAVLNSSSRTVNRRWLAAKAWLRREMTTVTATRADEG